MDALDKISIAFIIVLVAALVLLGMDYQGKAAADIERAAKLKMNMAGISEIPVATIKVLKDLIELDNIKKAEALVNDLLGKYPYDGEPHFFLGNIMMRKQNPISALYSYKEAVDLNPDYVDKKASMFQGRKIKVAIDESKESILAALAKNSGGSEMKKAKKTMYYLLRKLAGSCG